MLLALPLLLGPSSCDKPNPQVCQLCETCKANPAQTGCAQLLASGVCDSCGAQPTPTPPVTTTTTVPPPTTTTTTTTLPGPLPTPTPQPVLCKAPQGVQWTVGPITSRFDIAVNEAMHQLTSCSVGSDCPTGRGPQQWLGDVALYLRVHGFCSGQHEDGITDEIAVACTILSDDKKTCLLSNCQTAWEGKHVANFGNPVNAKVVWTPGADRVSWTPQSCPTGPPPTPAPTPLPTPLPTPGPTPTPGGACPIQLPVPQPYSLELRIGPHGSTGRQFDGTPYIKGPSSAIPPPGWTGACRTQQCDISLEKDPQNGLACTLQLCGAELQYDVVPSSAGFVNWTQGYTTKITLTGPAVLMAKCPVSGIVGSRNVP